MSNWCCFDLEIKTRSLRVVWNSKTIITLDSHCIDSAQENPVDWLKRSHTNTIMPPVALTYVTLVVSHWVCPFWPSQVKIPVTESVPSGQVKIPVTESVSLLVKSKYQSLSLSLLDKSSYQSLNMSLLVKSKYLSLSMFLLVKSNQATSQWICPFWSSHNISHWVCPFWWS